MPENGKPYVLSRIASKGLYAMVVGYWERQCDGTVIAHLELSSSSCTEKQVKDLRKEDEWRHDEQNDQSESEMIP